MDKIRLGKDLKIEPRPKSGRVTFHMRCGKVWKKETVAIGYLLRVLSGHFEQVDDPTLT